MFRGKLKTPRYDPNKWLASPAESLVRLYSADRKIPSVYGLLGIFVDRLDASLYIEAPPENKKRVVEIVKKIALIDLFTGNSQVPGDGLRHGVMSDRYRGNYQINSVPDSVWEYSQGYLGLITDMLELATRQENSIFHRQQYEDSHRRDAVRDAVWPALNGTLFAHDVVASYLHNDSSKRMSELSSNRVLDLTKEIMEDVIPTMSRSPIHINPPNFILPHLPPRVVADLLSAA